MGNAIERTTCAVLKFSGQGGGIECLLVRFESILNTLLPILAALALVGLFYGLVQYVFKAGDEESKKEAKRIIVAGIVALFLMAAIGGIVNFLVEATGLDSGFFNTNTFDPPTIDPSQSNDNQFQGF